MSHRFSNISHWCVIPLRFEEFRRERFGRQSQILRSLSDESLRGNEINVCDYGASGEGI